MTRYSCTLILLTGFLFVSACTTAPRREGDRVNLHEDVQATIRVFKEKDPAIEKFFKNAAGYAVFPAVAKGGAGLGGAYGKGELYERRSIQNDKMIGHCDLTQGSIGLQLGGQVYSEVVFFQTEKDVETFKTGNFSLAAQASAVALTSGIAKNLNYSNGVIVITAAKGGLMYEVSVGGQKFSFQSK